MNNTTKEKYELAKKMLKGKIDVDEVVDAVFSFTHTNSGFGVCNSTLELLEDNARLVKH